MKTFIGNILILFMFASCCQIQNRYDLHITNNSANDIGCYFYLSWQGGNEGIVYPDTTLALLRTNEVIVIKAGQTYHGSRPVSSISEWILSLPSDTLSIFYFHPDTLQKYTWEEIRQGYKVLRRYDLSIKDILTLKNRNDVPEIPYPPDERMKYMKMYPLYESE